jgi:hypothetical protein
MDFGRAVGGLAGPVPGSLLLQGPTRLPGPQASCASPAWRAGPQSSLYCMSAGPKTKGPGGKRRSAARNRTPAARAAGWNGGRQGAEGGTKRRKGRRREGRQGRAAGRRNEVGGNKGGPGAGLEQSRAGRQEGSLLSSGGKEGTGDNGQAPGQESAARGSTLQARPRGFARACAAPWDKRRVRHISRRRAPTSALRTPCLSLSALLKRPRLPSSRLPVPCAAHGSARRPIRSKPFAACTVVINLLCQCTARSSGGQGSMHAYMRPQPSLCSSGPEQERGQHRLRGSWVTAPRGQQSTPMQIIGIHRQGFFKSTVLQSRPLARLPATRALTGPRAGARATAAACTGSPPRVSLRHRRTWQRCWRPWSRPGPHCQTEWRLGWPAARWQPLCWS